MWRGLTLSLAVAVAVLSAPVGAWAASVAYIDGGNVWVSSLDGAQKKQLTTDGEWDEVAQSDNGRIVGVRREGAVFGQFNTMRVWEPNGAEAFQGALTKNGNWVQYAFPLSLDMSSDGDFIAYGYSNFTYGFPVSSLENGTSVITARQPYFLDAISDAGPEWPTFFGRRIVAAAGSTVDVQNAGIEPFGRDYTPWSGITPGAIPGFVELRRTDVAATGRMIAFEVELNEGGTIRERIGVVNVAGLGQPFDGPADCFLPAQGNATNVSLSPDGTRIAWKDDGGVSVAGVPTSAADPCVFSSPKVVISATGKYPSIGGANVTDMIPPPSGGSPTTPAAPTSPTSPTGPGGTAPTGTAPTVLSVKLPASTSVAALRKGLAVRVGAPRAGLVTVTATVPGKRLGLKGAAARRPALIAKGAARVASARVIAVRLKLTALGRAKAARLKGAKATVRIKLGTTLVKRTLRVR